MNKTETSPACLLKTAIAFVRANDHRVLANILFDEGAQSSFVTQSLANKLDSRSHHRENLSIIIWWWNYFQPSSGHNKNYAWNQWWWCHNFSLGSTPNSCTCSELFQFYLAHPPSFAGFKAGSPCWLCREISYLTIKSVLITIGML